jgi:hypothetical protein
MERIKRKRNLVLETSGKEFCDMLKQESKIISSKAGKLSCP